MPRVTVYPNVTHHITGYLPGKYPVLGNIVTPAPSRVKPGKGNMQLRACNVHPLPIYDANEVLTNLWGCGYGFNRAVMVNQVGGNDSRFQPISMLDQYQVDTARLESS
jgi:hypothetical protein